MTGDNTYLPGDEAMPVDSQPISSGSLLAPSAPGNDGRLVFGTDAAGKIVLMAPIRTGRTTLNAHTTALAFVQIAIFG